jgi:uncharacterized protein (TIGR00159 family)
MSIQQFGILADLRWQDVLDIFFLSTFAYYLYVWFWGTKAVKAVVGLLALGLVFLAARMWGLFLTTWVFQILWQVAVFLLIILFQSEIRQVLERVNPFHFIGARSAHGSGGWISGLVEAVFSLARQGLGALVIVERQDRVEEWISGGVAVNGDLSYELLVSLFQKGSSLHDGAVLVRGGKAICAASFLPLSSAEGLPSEWGTRHRAALGLSERCDAWVVVASEERGSVAVAQEGEMREVSGPSDLSQLLTDAFAGRASGGMTLWGVARDLMVRRWLAKVISAVFVSLVWFLLAGQQNVEIGLKVPLITRNLPEQMEVVEPVEPKVEVTFRGLRKDTVILNEGNVHVELDLSLVRMGRRTFRITRDQVVTPSDRVQVVRIEPAELRFQFREKS